MTDPTGQPPAQQSSTAIRFGDLKKLIRDMIDEAREAVVGDTPPTPRERGSMRQQSQTRRDSAATRSVEDEVRAAIGKLDNEKKEREARQQRDAQYERDINELKERTKEKPPVERRRVHKIMGWGD